MGAAKIKNKNKKACYSLAPQDGTWPGPAQPPPGQVCMEFQEVTLEGTLLQVNATLTERGERLINGSETALNGNILVLT